MDSTRPLKVSSRQILDPGLIQEFKARQVALPGPSGVSPGGRGSVTTRPANRHFPQAPIKRSKRHARNVQSQLRQ
ncbi:hypothetical protein AAFF_G00353940 [Aldrovandia affinis]|uniref:Uncharacterized protein n=1 Tax=Aldrovandia affinis TaxID=143900 RepID=A0AAD7SJD9_9TELE|nr:hypothetical protein AAFF_G00353940 [Aldrovandia affinis]